MNTTPTPASTTASASLKNYSLEDLQRLNNDIYAIANGRNFDLLDLVCRLYEYNSRVSLRIRHDNVVAERAGYYFCMMLSWLFAIANRLSLETAEGIKIHFHAASSIADKPLAELQEEFVMQHPNATPQNASMCLSERIEKIGSAIAYFRGTHEKHHLDEIAKRIAQSIEAVCVLAGMLGVKLDDEFAICFRDGCPTCRKIPCKCGFRTDKVM